LLPGATITGFAEISGIENALIFKVPTLQSSAASVAEAGVNAMLAGQSKVITGWFSHLAWFCGWMFPEDLVAWVAFIFWCNPRAAMDMLLRRDARRKMQGGNYPDYQDQKK